MDVLAINSAFLPSTSVVVAALAGYLAYLVFTHRNCALGTKERPDLETRSGYPIIGNLLEFLEHGDHIVNRKSESCARRRLEGEKLTLEVMQSGS